MTKGILKLRFIEGSTSLPRRVKNEHIMRQVRCGPTGTGRIGEGASWPSRRNARIPHAAVFRLMARSIAAPIARAMEPERKCYAAAATRIAQAGRKAGNQNTRADSEAHGRRCQTQICAQPVKCMLKRLRDGCDWKSRQDLFSSFGLNFNGAVRNMCVLLAS